jgi:adenylate kinase family enzyme
MTEDLISLLEQHKQEIWEWKQKESQWLRDKNQLDGNKLIIEELSTKLIAMKKRAQEAEGETILVKGIGINSPEMKELQSRVKQLDDSLAMNLEINESHQRYNGKLQLRLTEVEEDNKRLSKQIQDLTTPRKFGDGTH